MLAPFGIQPEHYAENNYQVERSKFRKKETVINNDNMK